LQNEATSFDALLVVSFGGPEGMEDVIPFLENVLRGRNVPRERMLKVAHHYEMFGGVSPINQENRNLIEALRVELSQHGPAMPIYWGNRNWHPLLPDTLRQMASDGVKNALAFVTSAYSSYSSCRQYLENIEDARFAAGATAPRVTKLRPFYNHPLFIQANVNHARTVIQLSQARTLVFTAHSIPESMAANCDYADQLLEASKLVADELGIEHWKLVYQSRSGSPTQPWLGPDVCEHLRQLRASGIRDVAVVPIGFVSDHMEVIYDLDVEAQHVSKEIGLNMVRAATAGTDPAFVQMIRELIMEKTNNETPRFLGSRGPSCEKCFPTCCLKG